MLKKYKIKKKKKKTYPGTLKTAGIGFGNFFFILKMTYPSAFESAGIGTAYASAFESAGIGLLNFIHS